MKKIGIFTGYFLPHLGGVERYVDKLSSELQRLGYDIVIVTSNHESLKSHEKIAGRTMYRLPIRNIAKNRYPIPDTTKDYKSLIQQIEAENFDYYIVNTRFHLTSLVGAKMGKRANKPVLLIEHGTGHFTVGNRLLDFFGKIYEHILSWILKRYVDRFYGVSKKCNVWLRHFSIKANGVFYNAIDAADRNKVQNFYANEYPDSTVVITYAGRLIREKGILNLLEAFKRVEESGQLHQAIKLVIAGDGDLSEVIKQKYADPAIDMLGRLDFEHVMALYKRTDIFVYPSLYPEGLPTSILEAGLMNCAIIATPKGGTEEVIINDSHGIITDGSVTSLQEAIELLVADSSKRRALANTVKQRIEQIFNWDAVAKEVDHELKSLDTK